MEQKQLNLLKGNILYIQNIYKDLDYIIQEIDKMQWNS